MGPLTCAEESPHASLGTVPAACAQVSSSGALLCLWLAPGRSSGAALCCLLLLEARRPLRSWRQAEQQSSQLQGMGQAAVLPQAMRGQLL